MNLLEAVKKQRSLAQRNKIISYVAKDPKRFAELIDIFLEGPYRITQYASWPITVCAERYPDLLKPHLKKLVKNLRREGLHDAVKRNTVRSLQFIDVPKSLQGEVVDVCFKYLTGDEALAIKVFSMTVLARIAKDQPELKNELIPIIEDQMPYGSPGLRSRGSKILKKLKAL